MIANVRLPKVIVFDLDNTLVCLTSSLAKRMYIEFAYKVIGISPDKAEECYEKGYASWKKIVNSLPGRKKYLKLWELCFKNAVNEQDAIKLAYEFQKEFDENCSDLLYPDVISTFNELRSRQLVLGIFSERSELAIKRCLIRHNILHFFDFYFSAQDTDPIEAKMNDNSWKTLIASINNMGFDKKEILYVGDEYEVDILQALKHGIKTVLIDRNGNHQTTRCIKIRGLDELCDILGMR